MSYSCFPEDKIYTYSIQLFFKMARNQFFFDVNKRIGRFMMNGILLAHGYPIISVVVTKNYNLMN